MTAETVQGDVLVVDDNRINRLTLARSLEQAGHRPALAESGEEALELLAASTFDVVLLDLVMPGLDGYEVLGCIKSDPETRHIPVIVISAVDEIDSAVRCIEMGAEDYLPKPFNAVLLRARLNASLQKKRLRDMEKAYLQQELTLRQSEKLATLGRLSAGMAHELNNPAAAAQRGAAQLRAAFEDLQAAQLQLGALDLDPEQAREFARLDSLARTQANRPTDLDPLARSDLEEALEARLEEVGVADAWQVASTFADLGLDDSAIESLAATFSATELPTVLRCLHSIFVISGLIDEVAEGTGRISEIVTALKSYSFMDRAPIQEVDVHTGLDNTLVMLRSKLREGITVHRSYADDLPRIQAYGSELNQVWTNLLDNAIYALEGRGDIRIETSWDEDWVGVAIEDSGHGIPESFLPRLFDPFSTTKPPGDGTGLGLNICHTIVVRKHGGRIEVTSRPGRTRFEVSLPRDHLEPESADVHPGPAAGGGKS